MKTELSTATLRLLATAASILFISSCALPPREAMRIVQRDGLIPYMMGNYNSSYTFASPLQTHRPYFEPRPVNPIPYRTTYHTNRYTQTDFNRVPYRPRTVTTSRPKSSSMQRRSTSVVSVPAPVKTAPEKTVVAKETPKTQAPTAETKPAEQLPYGTPVVGRPGMVTSPYAEKQQLVDVTGMSPGDTVKDPYSGKLFKVPPTQQADTSTAKPAAPTADPAAKTSEDKPATPPAASAPKP